MKHKPNYMLDVYRITFRTMMAQGIGKGMDFTQLKIVYTAHEVV